MARRRSVASLSVSLTAKTAAFRKSMEKAMRSVKKFAAGIKAITDRLDTMNGSVAENTRFRVQQKAVYGAIAAGWAIMMAPLLVVLAAVLK